jgi:hypothetical protein
MRKLLFLPIFCLLCICCFSQVHIGLFGGIGNYQGDLINGLYVAKLTRPAVGITGSYELSKHLAVRAGLTFAEIAGSDRYNSKDYLKLRNLSFESNVLELSLTIRKYILNP